MSPCVVSTRRSCYSCAPLFGFRTARIPSHLHPVCTPRARSFAHQRFLWCIGRSNSTWREFCMQIWELPVDNNRQQATQAVSKTDENLKHTVRTAQGVPNSPFQGLSEYTPYTPPPPNRTHSGQKYSDNDDDHQKPTELVHSLTSPRDMCIRSLSGFSLPVYVFVRTCLYAFMYMLRMLRSCHSPQSLEGRYPQSSGPSVKLWTISGSPGTHCTASGWRPPTRSQWPVALIDGILTDL